MIDGSASQQAAGIHGRHARCQPTGSLLFFKHMQIRLLEGGINCVRTHTQNMQRMQQVGDAFVRGRSCRRLLLAAAAAVVLWPSSSRGVAMQSSLG